MWTNDGKKGLLTQVTGSERGFSVGAGWLGGREKKNDEDLLLMSDT